MAFTYGTVTKCKVRNGQTRNEYECRIGYQVNGQDIVTNTSNVTLRLECRSINSSYATYNLNKGLTSVIDGTTIKDDQPVDMRETNVWQNFGEKTITIYHNPDGTYSESKTGSFTCTAGTSQYSLQSGSASVTIAPATIPRYANVTQHYISRVSTSSITVYWNADASCDGLQCSLNGGGWFDVGGYPEYTLTGLAANTTYSIRTRIKRADSQLWTESETIWGTTYPIIYPTLSLKYKTVNSIEVNAGANIEASSIQYRIRHINGAFGEWQYSNVFGGLSPNNTYIIEVYMISKQSGEGGYASLTETTYDYAKMTAAPDITIGQNPTVDFYNPSGQSIFIFTENIVNGSAESSFTEQENITGKANHTINLDTNLMYSKIPSTTKGIIRYVIRTNCNNVDYYHWIDREYYVNEAINKPIFNNFLYEDTNAKTVALTGNNKIFVKDYSNLAVIIPYANRAIAQNYASMLSYRLNVGNMTSISTDYNKENAEVRMYLDAINSPSITVTAIDSRQFSTPASYMLDFRAYEEPIIKGLAATRQDGGVSDQVDLSFNGTWWNDNFGAVHNSIKSIEYYYKATTSSDWIKGNTVLTPNIDGNYFNGTIEQIEGPKADTKGFDISTAYNIKLIVIDELQTSAEYQTILGTGTPALAICNNKVAIGSRYDEQLGGALQVKGEIIEEGLRVSKEEPSTKEKLWVKTGKNEFNINNLNVFMGGYANYTIKDKSIILTSVNSWARIDLLVRLEPHKQYTLSVDVTNNETNQEYRASNITIFSKDYSVKYIEAYMNEAEGKIILTFTPFEEEVFILLYSNPTGQVLNNTVTFSNLQIEKGSVATEYEDFIDTDIYAKVNNYYKKILRPNDVAISPAKPNRERLWVEYSRNLYNPETDIEFTSHFRDFNTGNIASTTSHYGVKIKVKPNTVYVTSSDDDVGAWSNLCFFDIDMNYISGSAYNGPDKVFTTPSNCFYVTIAIQHTATWFQLQEGYIPTEYEPYSSRKLHIDREEVLNLERARAQQTYSSAEQVIGTWVDGKPLYRRTIYTTSKTGSLNFGFDYGLLRFRDVNAAINEFLFPVSRYTSTGGDELNFFIHRSNKTFEYGTGDAWSSNFHYLVFDIEYTKTTD